LRGPSLTITCTAGRKATHTGISPNPIYFLAAGAAALLISWATVFLHTLGLARTSPVHALRDE
jgi:hypothetical protein